MRRIEPNQHHLFTGNLLEVLLHERTDLSGFSRYGTPCHEQSDQYKQHVLHDLTPFILLPSFKTPLAVSCLLHRASSCQRSAPHRMERTTPPSTRRAAPLVAEDSGLAMNVTSAATSSVVPNRLSSELGRTVSKNSLSTTEGSTPRDFAISPKDSRSSSSKALCR